MAIPQETREWTEPSEVNNRSDKSEAALFDWNGWTASAIRHQWIVSEPAANELEQIMFNCIKGLKAAEFYPVHC